MKTMMNCVMCGEVLTPPEIDSGKCSRCQADEKKPNVFGAGGLHPSLPLSMFLALVLGTAFYAVGPLLLLRETAVYHLFCGHGWVPYVCVASFFCALVFLIFKLPLIRKEQKAFSLQLLPEAIDAQIQLGDVQRILERISRLSRKQRSLLLVTRIRQAMLRLNQLGTAEKLDDFLRYRAEADESAMDSSYAAPKFIVWAIPVLGFVGTVLGISNGVQAFSTLIQNASDLEGLRESLKGVTYGLGQAFENTMIALCMSLVLMLVMSWIQRCEDRLLAAIDDYCMENLLHKITVGTGNLSDHAIRELTETLRETILQLRDLPRERPVNGRNLSEAALVQEKGNHGTITTHPNR